MSSKIYSKKINQNRRKQWNQMKNDDAERE